MKPIAIVGTVLLVLGAVVLVRGLSFKAPESVLKIGDLNVTAEKNHQIPVWAGVAAVAGGVILLGAGMGRRNS